MRTVRRGEAYLEREKEQQQQLGAASSDSVNGLPGGAVRERVIENADILISFDLPHMVLFDDLAGWTALASFGLLGGTFKFYPWSAFGDYYNCVLEDSKFAPKRNALRKYGTSEVWRILQDGQAPATPEIVLRRFHGVTP